MLQPLDVLPTSGRLEHLGWASKRIKCYELERHLIRLGEQPFVVGRSSVEGGLDSPALQLPTLTPVPCLVLVRVASQLPVLDA